MFATPPRQGAPARALFLDRDGVLIPDTGYPSNPAEIKLTPGAPEALRRLRDAGYALVLVSNQAGVARGYFSLERMLEVHRHVEFLLGLGGVELDLACYCPHHPTAGEGQYRLDCACRKPRPGMLLAGARALQLDLTRSWMVGDKESDVEAAVAAGCRALRVNGPRGGAEASVADLPQAAAYLLALDADREGGGDPPS